ncbi:MAG: ABC transporter ATP-binding protein [Bacillota bacterium]
MIRIKGLIKKFGRVTALRGLDMTVPAGTIYAFVGQNGAGKTTTLRILAALLPPDGGTVEVAGYNAVKNPRAVRELVGYMPDFFGVYDDLRVGEYLLFYAAAYGIRGPEAARRRDNLLELVGLGEKREDFVDTLSRGMQQRLCLARALVHDPPVLLLDEPASGLDPLARVELRKILRELGRTGKTIVISSHILPELADFCNYVGMITEGRMVYEGPLTQMIAAVQVQQIVLRVAGEQTPALKVIEAWPNAAVVKLTDEQVELRLAGGEAEAAALLKELVQAGAAVTHFARTEQTLEDAFVQIASEVK